MMPNIEKRKQISFVCVFLVRNFFEMKNLPYKIRIALSSEAILIRDY